MSRTAQIIWQAAGVSIVASLLIAAVVWAGQTEPNLCCSSIVYIYEDGNKRMYVSENELNRLLTSQHLYPVEKPLSSISLQGIERTIQNHPMIRTAECYLTPRNEVKVRITQRVPLLRVQQASNTYFIDRDRLVMPAFSTVKDSVLVVSGSVNESLASTQIADFAEWLRGNSYWRGQVKSVYVGTPHMIYLYLHGPNQPRIVLGEIHGYKQKLAKLRTFLDKGSEATADKQYSELDLRFKGQVIGRN